MPVSDLNARIVVTIPKELKAKLEEQAKKENRSVNNLIATVLVKYGETLK